MNEQIPIDTLQPLVEALGLDYATVAGICVNLVGLRLVLKLFSGKLQAGLEKAINSAVASGDSRIIGWIGKVINSIPYRLLAWAIDTVFSVKLPLKVKKPEIEMPGS